MRTEEAVQRFEEMEGDRAALLARTDGLDHERLNRKPGPGEWSVMQVICHLTAAEELSLAYVQKKIGDGDSVPRTGLASKLKSVFLTTFLRSGLKVKAPPRTAELPEESEFEPARAAWDRVRADWRRTLESFPSELSDRAIFRHPYVGLLNLDQTLRFTAEHLNHHAKQVDRILVRV